MQRPDARTRKLGIVFNPLSGGNRRTEFETITAELRARGASLALREAIAPADIAAAAGSLARSGGCDAVVAAGGDGTIRAVAIGLAGSGIAMGVIPLGTANVLAGELGLPSDPEGIASMLLDGRVMALSCGRIADGPFLLMVGAGFDAAVVASVSSRIKRTFGKLAYVGPFIRALARGPQTFAATIDGVDHQCTWLVVANARNYAGRFVIARDRNLTAPGLTALAVTTRSRLGLLRVVLAIALGRTPPASLARLVPCRTATIPPGQDVPVQVDGDHLAATSVAIGPDKISLDLVVPQRVANLTCG